MKKTCAFIASSFVIACSGSSSNGVPGPLEGAPSDGTTTTTSPTDPSAPGDPGDSKSDEGKSDPPATTAPPATATAADCKAWATAYCAKAGACGHLAAKIMGAACEARMTGACEAHVSAPGSGYTKQALATCTSALPTMTCSEGCAFVGTLPLGADCAFDDQCASAACDASGVKCGECVVAPKAAPAPKAGLGEVCDEGGKTAPDCDAQIGLWCDGVTKRCAEIPTAALGGSCGYLGGMIVMCASGGTCKPGTTGSGTCVAEKALGEACTGGAGYDECAFGTKCIAGTCAYRTAAAICK